MLSLETFFQDLKHSLRMFRQSWGFTLAAVAALALGIGANTAIFSVVSAVLLKPVPFPEPERLVMFMTTFPQGQNAGASPAKFQHFREQSTVVQDGAAFRNGVVNYTGGALPEQLRSAQVSADYFKLFGAPVIRGRTFSAEEDRPNGERVVLISQNLWTRRFNGDPNDHRPAAVAERRPVHGDWHHRLLLQRRGVRPAARRVDGLPARSEHERSGALLPVGRTPEGRRHARAGQGALRRSRPATTNGSIPTRSDRTRRSACSRSARRSSAT